jgi:hypothetical protein
MAGEKETTVQDYVNQTVPKGDAPAQNRGASAGLGGQAPQVDKRAITAVIKALARTKKLVVPLDVVDEELSKMIEDYGEREQSLHGLIDAIDAGVVKHIHIVRGRRLVISLRELSEEDLQTLRSIAKLHEFDAYDGNKTEVDNVIHNLVRMWDDPCFGMANAAEAAYYLAKEYGLGIKRIMNMRGRDGYGTVVYSIEDSILVSETFTPCPCDEEKRRNDCCEVGGVCAWWEFVEPSDTEINALIQQAQQNDTNHVER